MASRRRIHVRRQADIVIGSLINGAKTKVQKLALQKQIELTVGKAEFNEIIRNNSPSIYLVDPDLIATVVLEQVLNNATETISHIITSNGLIAPEDADFSLALREVIDNYSSLHASIKEAVHKGLMSFPSVNIDELNKTLQPIYSDLLKDLQSAYEKNKTYRAYQRAAAKAGSNLRRTLNAIKISILDNADSFISNINNRVPFVTYSFTSGVRSINTNIQKSLTSAIESKIALSSNFKIGNLVHAGHVGLYSDKGLEGINMPGAFIAGLITKKFDEIEQAVGNLSIHVINGLKINTDYSGDVGMFLDLQFNFAVSMEGVLNREEAPS